MTTDDLIADLARRAGPFRALRPPAPRAIGWLAAAVGCALGGVAVFGLRPHVADVMTRPAFIFTALAALDLTVIAAAAALVRAIPGAGGSGGLTRAAIAIAGIWSMVLMASLVAAGRGFSGVADWPICFARVIGIGLVPVAVLARMLGDAAPLERAWSGALAAMAGMAVAAGAIQFICPLDNSAHVLLGHFGPVAVSGVLGAWIAPNLLGSDRHQTRV